MAIGLEHATITVSDPQDIATYQRLFGLMESAAVTDDAARQVLERVQRGER